MRYVRWFLSLFNRKDEWEVYWQDETQTYQPK